MFEYVPIISPVEIPCINYMENMKVGRGTSLVPFQSPNFFCVSVLHNIKNSKKFKYHSNIKILVNRVEKKKEGNIKINGKAQFDSNHKLVLPDLKKKKSAEELLKEIPSTPEQRKIDREIVTLENQVNEKKAKRPHHKEVKAETMVEKICKIEGVTSHFNKYDNIIKFKGKTLMWVSDRQYGLAVSTWQTGRKNWHTERVYNQKQMYDQIEKLKEKIKNE